MDGLEDQAEAAANRIIDNLYTQDTVQIKHSSRDSLILRVSEALKTRPNITAKKLIIRSGISLSGLECLEEALQTCTNVEELEFYCLQDITTLEAAIQCCRRSGIKRLGLKNYSARMLRQNRNLVSETIRSGLMPDLNCHEDDKEVMSSKTHGKSIMLEYLEIANYPIGAEGAQILSEAVSKNTALKTLKLIDCDLRSDSATYIANIIRASKSIEILDLSYNRHYLGSQITRELTVKTLVQRGLKHNTILQELHMDQTRGAPIDRSKIDQQLDINRFRKAYLDSERDPMSIPPHAWCHLLGRVSAKPAVLHNFLQDCVSAGLFTFRE